MSAPQSSAPSDAPRFKVGDRVRQTTMRKGVVEGRGSYRQPYLVKFDDGGRAWPADVELAPLSASTDSPQKSNTDRATELREVAERLSGAGDFWAEHVVRDAANRLDAGLSKDEAIRMLNTFSRRVGEVDALFAIAVVLHSNWLEGVNALRDAIDAARAPSEGR